MTHIISLYNPTNNKFSKKQYFNGTYKDAEDAVIVLNDKLNKSSNISGKYWKVTAINV